jgi:hypothetical protein
VMWKCTKVLERCPLYYYEIPSNFGLINSMSMQVYACSPEHHGSRIKRSRKGSVFWNHWLEQKGRFYIIYHLSWTRLHFCLQSKYLEKQYNDAQSQLRDIVSS